MSPLRLRVERQGKLKKYYYDIFLVRFHTLGKRVAFLQLPKRADFSHWSRGFAPVQQAGCAQPPPSAHPCAVL
jgi:hypothetical protein